MPFKVIMYLFGLVVFTLFVGFNLDNRCDVSFVFHVFRDVPVVISMLFAFCAGAVCVIPLLLSGKKKKAPPAPPSAKGPKKKGPVSGDEHLYSPETPSPRERK